MQKKQYEQPVMNIKLFQAEDVIFTSGDLEFDAGQLEDTAPADSTGF